MNNRSIITIVFAILSISLVFVVFYRIHLKNYEKKEIVRTEQSVKNKLKIIREAQIAYFNANKKYAGNWDELIQFLNDGSFYITERKETIIQRPYGGDSVVVNIDTLGTVSVKDSLFNKRKYPSLNFKKLAKLPHDPEKEFSIYAAETAGIQVMEIVDTKPVDPLKISGQRAPLAIGSRFESTTKGNWEK